MIIFFLYCLINHDYVYLYFVTNHDYFFFYFVLNHDYFVTNHDYFLITMIVMILYQVASGLAGNALARFVRYEYILYMT